MTERIFTISELLRYTGEDGGPILISYLDIVYDVSACPRWRSGMHEQMHFPGQDLTSELPDAPHKDEVFRHACVKQVGHLKMPGEPG
jgi:predicted heme/steroid binding protein